MKPSIDGLGFYRMDENLHIEVLPYDKILNDAKKRNKVFFDKIRGKISLYQYQ